MFRTNTFKMECIWAVELPRIKSKFYIYLGKSIISSLPSTKFYPFVRVFSMIGLFDLQKAFFK